MCTYSYLCVMCNTPGLTDETSTSASHVLLTSKHIEELIANESGYTQSVENMD